MKKLLSVEIRLNPRDRERLDPQQRLGSFAEEIMGTITYLGHEESFHHGRSFLLYQLSNKFQKLSYHEDFYHDMLLEGDALEYSADLDGNNLVEPLGSDRRWYVVVAHTRPMRHPLGLLRAMAGQFARTAVEHKLHLIAVGRLYGKLSRAQASH